MWTTAPNFGNLGDVLTLFGQGDISLVASIVFNFLSVGILAQAGNSIAASKVRGLTWYSGRCACGLSHWRLTPVVATWWRNVPCDATDGRACVLSAGACWRCTYLRPPPLCCCLLLHPRPVVGVIINGSPRLLRLAIEQTSMFLQAQVEPLRLLAKDNHTQAVSAMMHPVPASPITNAPSSPPGIDLGADANA